MVDLEIPLRHLSVRLLGVMALCVSGALAEPAVVSPRLQVKFPALTGGLASESTAVPVGESLFVVVVAPGANPTSPEFLSGGQRVGVEIVGHDPVSRLAFLKVPASVPTRDMQWLKETAKNPGVALQFMEGGKLLNCQVTTWVKQVGGKILPLALIQVDFGRQAPPPGTPLLDGAGRIAGIVFQSAGNTSGYAIPVEAVHRVKHDICDGNGQLTRGWLGLALQANAQLPQVSRVLPASPAAGAGILPNDVLTAVGSRAIKDYADAANAFFYLMPDQPVSVSLQRNGTPMEFSLTPVAPK
ncbi:MAG: serine protease [Verrucomicrobiaceae bacterium]|nr:MAG: serine protease [Verrucomicrobiaceae bacterium]